MSAHAPARRCVTLPAWAEPLPRSAALAAGRARRTPRRRPPAGRRRPAAAGDPPGPPGRARAARRPAPPAADDPHARARAALAAGGRPGARRRRAGLGQPGRPGGDAGRPRRSSARTPRGGSRRAPGLASACARPPAPVAIVRGLLRGAGLGLAAAGTTSRRPGWSSPPTSRSAATIDPLVREGAPHLLVICGAAARVGPFVRARAGPPACAASTPTSPSPTRGGRWCVEQVARAAPARDGAPVDPTLEVAGAGLGGARPGALRRGRPPRRPGRPPSTIDHAAPAVRREWERHPHCGCAWDVVLVTGSPVLAVELPLHARRCSREQASQ